MTTPDDVKATWDRIADHFARTRVNPWPEVETFCDNHTGDLGVDVGTGNGRHAELLTDSCTQVLALDISNPMLETARTRLQDSATLLQGDAATLPLKTSVVDLGLSIATIHHLPTEATRRQSIEELARVLTPDGCALVSVWSTAHDRFDADTGFDTTIDWTLPDDTIVDRYYHIYTPAEFRTFLEDSACSIVDWAISSGNCYATIGPPE